MNDAEFMQLLSAAHRAAVKKTGDRLARERQDCLKITRARLIALDPDAATAEEKTQLAACSHCAKLVEQMKAGLPHPTLWSIVRWLAGLAEGDEAKAMGWHLEDDGCRRCNRVARSLGVRSLAEALRAGTRTAEQVRALADAAVGMLAPLPAAAGGFASREQIPYMVSQQREDGGLKVSVRETASGELAATVSAPGQAMDGKKVWLELVGDQGTLSGKLTLRSQGSAGCGGRATWPIEEALTKLGTDYFALALPEESI
jgi:hypothetical protein